MIDQKKNLEAGFVHLFANICYEKRLQDEDLESHMQPLLSLHETRQGFKVLSLQKTHTFAHSGWISALVNLLK